MGLSLALVNREFDLGRVFVFCAYLEKYYN